jgi:plasmid stabilization system protein ParE
MKFGVETTLVLTHDFPSSAAACVVLSFRLGLQLCRTKQTAALEDLAAAYKYAARNAPDTAARWLNRFHEALNTLDHNPERCPLALEDDLSERTLRQYLFGKRPKVFRVIYTVDSETVWILRIRRSQRRTLTRHELGEPNQ